MAHPVMNRLREVLGNRRHAPRRKAKRRALLLLGGLPPGGGIRRQFECHTRDISDAGLALVVPGLDADDRGLAGEGAVLAITLDLPGAPVRVLAEAVRREPLAGGCLIAARITRVGGGERALLARHLEGLRRQVGRYAP